MSKGTRWIKRVIALSLVLLLSIESFGAIVSDNDGSAFITKAEFDSLKNDFQAQIDNYNTSIDTKIDGAIAAYLAGVRLSQVSDLITAIGDHYELPLVNYKSTLQVKNELKECYFAMDFAGFWNFSSSTTYITNPACIVCTSDGEGHSGFVLDKKFEKEDEDYEIKTMYKKMNLMFSDRYVNGDSAYGIVCYTNQQYVHGYCTLNFGTVTGSCPEVDDGWLLTANGGDVNIQTVSGWEIRSVLDTDTTKNREITSPVPAQNSATRQVAKIHNKFKVVGTKTDKLPFIISNADVKVPLVGSDTFTRGFHTGFHKDKWPKTMSSDWQDVSITVLTKVNPERSNYKLRDLTTDIRKMIPTFLEKNSGTFNKLDTLQKCAKLYTFFDVKGKNTKVYPISGAILAVMEKNAEKVDFVFDFKKTINNKKYHLLFKKNEGFTSSDITNLKSIDYILNGKKAEKTDYADSGEIKVTINNLEKGDVLWMTWVTNDTADGGTLNKIVSAKMTSE